MTGIDMQRISLGALIIALALMVDDAMTTTDAMLTRLAQGDDKVEAATFAFRTYAFAMLAGTLVTIAGFVPVGFAASGAGEYTFSLFAVVTIALIASWFVAVLFAPLLGVAILKPPKAAQSSDPGWVFRTYRTFLTWALRAKNRARSLVPRAVPSTPSRTVAPATPRSYSRSTTARKAGRPSMRSWRPT